MVNGSAKSLLQIINTKWKVKNMYPILDTRLEL